MCRKASISTARQILPAIHIVWPHVTVAFASGRLHNAMPCSKLHKFTARLLHPSVKPLTCSAPVPPSHIAVIRQPQYCYKAALQASKLAFKMLCRPASIINPLQAAVSSKVLQGPPSPPSSAASLGHSKQAAVRAMALQSPRLPPLGRRTRTRHMICESPCHLPHRGGLCLTCGHLPLPASLLSHVTSLP